MNRIKLTILLILTVTAIRSYSQQDAQFSHYMFNGLYFNPGYTGVENLLRMNFISRVQWLTYEPTIDKGQGGAPQSNILSVSTPIKNHKIGAGAFLLYESLGPLTNMNINLSAAKHFSVNNGLLSFGLNGGIFSQKISESYRVVNETDPVYIFLKENNGRLSQIKPDLNAGVWYEHQKFYAGVSFYHIPRSNFTFGATGERYDKIISSKLTNHMYITGGYRWKPAYTLDITPSFMVQTDLNQVTYLFGGLVEYNKKIWAGLNVRQSLAEREESKGGKTISNDDIILYVGLNLLKNKHNQDALRIGYAFDFVTSGVNAKKRTSHEIMVSYMIPNLFGPPRPPVRTPRYRHEN